MQHITAETTLSDLITMEQNLADERHKVEQELAVITHDIETLTLLKAQLHHVRDQLAQTADEDERLALMSMLHGVIKQIDTFLS